MPAEDPTNPFTPPATVSSGSDAFSPDAGKFARCPSCGISDAKKVGWTLWGGALGPRIFHHVACNNCRTRYNGKTGKSNTTAITIYVVISTVLAVAVMLALTWGMR